MDLTTVVAPGAQSLVTAVLTDSWHQVCTLLSKRWARHRGAGTGEAGDGNGEADAGNGEAGAAAVEQARSELELARQQAVAVAGEGSESERAGRMELFWIGYLAGQLAARPELGEVVSALPALFGEGTSAAASPSPVSVNTKSISGTVSGNAIQADDVSGGIRIGR